MIYLTEPQTNFKLTVSLYNIHDVLFSDLIIQIILYKIMFQTKFNIKKCA